ncbi:HAD family hydrolase [Oribacterium sp. HCP28S3_H8]|uniref:HAD family hydrolase n=1 Tax=Oribacterium sp. HCP28S3_H8 TaxID=3438945 RepID=UPI003F8870E1
MAFRFALFDFDGVIADTETSNKEFLEKALAVFGVTLTDEERMSLVGTNDPHRIERFLSRANRTVTMEEYRAQRIVSGNTYENGDIAPMPGLISLLRDFRSKGIRTAVVSMTSLRLISIGLERMGMTDLFDTVIGGDMVTNHKPNPEPYQMAMERLGARPEECIIFEDSPVGISAGKAAGAFVVGYTGASIQQDTSEADCVLDCFPDFYSVISLDEPPVS